MNVWPWVTVVSIISLCVMVGSILGLNYLIGDWFYKKTQQKKPAVLETGIITGHDGIPLTGESHRRRARSITHGELPSGNPEIPKRP